MKLLYDVENSKWYNENGESFSSENPAIPYGNAERVEIQLYAEVTGTNSGSSAVSDWIKYTGFSGGGYGALLATDNNFLHWFKSALKTNVGSGSVTDPIDVTTTQSIDDIAESGNIYLYSDWETETVAYSSREAITGGIRFTPAEGNSLENSYSAGDQADIPEMLYAEAAMAAADSDPATGLFVFDFVCDSSKLRNKMQYNSVEKLDDCKGLEITIFQTGENNVVSIRKRFRCTTFRITGGIADIKTGVPVPSPEENQILALLNSFVAQGLEVQASANGSVWIDYANITDFQSLRWFHIRIKNSGSAWSDAIPLIVGATGNPGQSVYPYIAYASDTTGADFTLTWEENATSSLKYIAYKMSTEEIANPAASDFTGLWVRFGGLDLLPYWEDGGTDDPVTVDWDNVVNKPEEFPAESHSHSADAITDKTRQLCVEETTPNTLYLNKDVIVKSATHTSSTLTIDFPSIKNSAGENYTAQSGDVFTWEFWLTTTSTINSFVIGGSSTVVLLSGFPDTLELINDAATRHVFTLRGIYKSGAINNLKLLVNYAYSEAAV